MEEIPYWCNLEHNCSAMILIEDIIYCPRPPFEASQMKSLKLASKYTILLESESNLFCKMLCLFHLGTAILVLVIIIMLASSKIFAAFVDSKPIGKKTVLGNIC